MNLCILRPCRVHNRYGKWTGSVVFCTAYGRKCLYFTIHQNCPFPWGIWTSHVTHDAFSPYESTIQTAPRSVQPSLHRWPRSVSILYKGLPVFPQNCPFPCWHLDFIYYLVHWAHPSPERKWQLNRFSRFCRADKLTERQKDQQTTLLPAMRRNNAYRTGNYVGYGKAASVWL